MNVNAITDFGHYFIKAFLVFLEIAQKLRRRPSTLDKNEVYIFDKGSYSAGY